MLFRHRGVERCLCCAGVTIWWWFVTISALTWVFRTWFHSRYLSTFTESFGPTFGLDFYSLHLSALPACPVKLPFVDFRVILIFREPLWIRCGWCHSLLDSSKLKEFSKQSDSRIPYQQRASHFAPLSLYSPQQVSSLCSFPAFEHRSLTGGKSGTTVTCFLAIAFRLWKHFFSISIFSISI